MCEECTDIWEFGMRCMRDLISVGAGQMVDGKEEELAERVGRGRERGRGSPQVI